LVVGGIFWGNCFWLEAVNRGESLDAMRNREEPFDICVVGGGATGMGVALDAAVRGYAVCLVEQSDFGKGTSSRSTKLVHGGVRYLKQGDVSLVREALQERGRLVRNAPHLVRKQSFVIPGYSWMDGPFYGLGLKLYDALAGELGMGASRWLGKEEVVEALPTVRRERLRGGVSYFDGQFDDARLVIDLAWTATLRGAFVANYVKCVGLMEEEGKVVGVKVRDGELGEELEVRAKVVVNATGIFVDELRRGEQEMVTVSQGAHVVLPREFLPGEAALMVPKTSDGRVLFAVPWKEVVLVGTTDTPREEKLLEPRPLEEELEFILAHTEEYLGRRPKTEEVRSIYAGLRPLVRPPKSGGKTSAISRDHTIVRSENGLVTIAGGKWTTYRKMAEDLVDRVEEFEGWERRDCGTRDLRIETSGAERPGDFVELEMARRVEDVLARRTRALVEDARGAQEKAKWVGEGMAEALEKGDDWVETQVAEFEEVAKGWLPSI
ncbi:MAG: glycerol-3-phosphate dehydrogenase/oxidase, partial [Verrucomicrobiota bacterium]